MRKVWGYISGLISGCCVSHNAALHEPPSQERRDLDGGCVRMLSQDDELGEEVEFILDSGSDASCRPPSLQWVGKLSSADRSKYFDAQGNPLHVSRTRRAVLTFPDQDQHCSGVISETFLVAPSVETPLLAVGKMYRAGFGIENLGDGEMYLSNPDNTFRARVYLKNNSLAARCRIRVVSQLDHARDAPEDSNCNAQVAPEVPISSAQASPEVPSSSAPASPEVPSSSARVVSGIPGTQCSVRAVLCTIENLSSRHHFVPGIISALISQINFHGI